MNNTTLNNNSARDGSGIANFDGGTINISNSTLSDNNSDDGGGLSNRGTLTLTRSTVSGNSAITALSRCGSVS